MLPFSRAPRIILVPADDFRVGLEERFADRPGESKIVFPVARRMPVEEDSADAAGLVPVRQEEVVVAPGLEARVVGSIETVARSEEHTSELQSLMRISYAVFCLKKKTRTHNQPILLIKRLRF